MKCQGLLTDHYKKLNSKAKGTKKVKLAKLADTSGGGLLMTLYAELLDRITSRGVLTTLINLSSAAIHLGCLLKGNLFLPGETDLIEKMIIAE